MKKITLIFLLIPLLNNCGPYSAAVGPSLTMLNSGSILQASASYAGSSVMKKFKEDYNNELNVEKICPTVHSSELNEIFFETIDHMDCYFDPMSIHR
ncbi:hypothetical protein N8958_01220 [Candidatus Pelagibacter sp.]|nr:hypothetical protein [Candidatus Pelagibacter sp.]